jgi:hypothetical protein
MNRRQVLVWDFPEISGVGLGDQQCMPFAHWVDVLKGQNPVIFIDLKTRDISFYDLTKNTIFHGMPPLNRG